MKTAVNDHVFLRLPDKVERTKGGVLLPSLTGRDVAYGRVFSVGEKVPLSRLRVGKIAMFDVNGVKELTLSRMEQVKEIALTYDQVMGVVDDADVQAQHMPLPPACSDEEMSVEEAGMAFQEGLRGFGGDRA